MRKKLCLLISVVMLITTMMFSGSGVLAAGTTYYVSSSMGSDSNNGTSSSTPWQTLSKVSSVTFNAEDTICLKTGDTWQENLTLHGNGTSITPITLTSYGTGDRPILKRGKEVGSHVIDITGLSGWKILGLEICNAEKGINLDYTTSFNKDYIWIEDCYFHDIYQESMHVDQLGNAWGTAINLCGVDSAQTNGIRIGNITVKNCISKNNDGFFGPSASGTATNIYGAITIDSCTIQGSPYIGVAFVDMQDYSPILKDCVFVNNGGVRQMPYGGTDVLVSFCNAGGTVQDCEFGWRSIYPGDGDGCAIDYEYSDTNFNVVNCDIHDCAVYALMYCRGVAPSVNSGMQNCLLRNNNNASTTYNGTIFDNGRNSTGTISGNTYYLLSGKTFTDIGDSPLTVTGNTPGTLATVSTPTADKSAGLYGSQVTVSLSCATSGASIYYTTDGSYPTTSSTLYTGPINISRTSVLNAKAFKSGMERSYCMSNIYEIGPLPAHQSIFTSQVPNETQSDARYELGTKFYSTTDGNITKVRLYTDASEGGDHSVRIWRVSDSTCVAGPYTWNITSGTAGWKEFSLDTSLGITANTDYIVSVSNSTDKRYQKKNYEFNLPINNANLRTYTGSGAYLGTLGSMPTGSSNANYYRDVVFEPSDNVTPTPTPTPTPTATATPTPAGTNLAINKTVTASTTYGGYVRSNAVDGNTGSWWVASTGSFPQWIYVDLGSSQSLGSTKWIYADSNSRTFKYKIEGSNNTSDWTLLVDYTSSGVIANGCMTDTVSGSYRYVRLTITDISNSGWAAAGEFEVY